MTPTGIGDALDRVGFVPIGDGGGMRRRTIATIGSFLVVLGTDVASGLFRADLLGTPAHLPVRFGPAPDPMAIQAEINDRLGGHGPSDEMRELANAQVAGLVERFGVLDAVAP